MKWRCWAAAQICPNFRFLLFFLCSFHPPLIPMKILFINVAYFPSFIYSFRCELVPCIGQSPPVNGVCWLVTFPKEWWLMKILKHWCLNFHYSIARTESTIPQWDLTWFDSPCYRLIPNIGCYKIHTMWK